MICHFGDGVPEARRLGGKGASLCRLVQRGYRVPPGFVIPVAAFRLSIKRMGLGGPLEGLAEALQSGGDVVSLGAPLQRALLAGRIEPAILDPILEAVAQLRLWDQNPDGIVVRSSATVEDGAAHSFAGIFESLPIREADALERTIREVWASVFSPRALSYCAESGVRELPGMAVVVQRFLEADRSGVMFTRFEGRTLVEHVEGGCEKLVKGEVTPDQLWIPAPGAAPGESGALPVRHAQELSRLAASLEATFGSPQDVEWVLWRDQVHVVQSRPITTLATQPPAADGGSGAPGVEPILRGTRASSGWGSGPVHLVFNIDQALALAAGEVLVTPMTNPDMVVAMRKSAAIVTDVGGMICHAAIVSRELGLPCVVGTATATTTLREGDIVTVSGTHGAVYRDRPPGLAPKGALPPGGWPEIWSLWSEATRERPDLVPAVSTADALEQLPAGITTAVLIPDVDLRCDRDGLWADLEGMSAAEADRTVADYLRRVAALVAARGIRRLHVLPRDPALRARIEGLLGVVGLPALRLQREGDDAPPLYLGDGRPEARGVAVPLAVAATWREEERGRAPLPGMPVARQVAEDTLKFFGHQPGRSVGPMPDPTRRGRWWEVLPEYGRFHQEAETPGTTGDFTWLEIRPELVISALLKSLVQPGFEMVPRVMGFPDLPPMHTKWIRCRYHFRADVFAAVWRRIVRGTWDAGYMADLMRRVRRSYRQLEEVLVLFPATDEELAAIPPARIVALITSWWPRWVEFFALCWFIQAQGDDILYPFLAETADDALLRVGGAADRFAWPGLPELVAPTTPVMSGAYMASVQRVRQALLDGGCTTADSALSRLERGELPAVAAELTRHLTEWHWMRDRDLLFEPWDRPERVIRTALDTGAHAGPDYAQNLRRNRLALSLQYDLALAAGRADGVNHAARFLHDLNVERENHHVLWLKYSYPLRRLVLEVERRLVAAGSLSPGEIFFLQAPELLEAAANLPAPLADALAEAVRARRRGYRHEARFEESTAERLTREDDYY